MPEQTLSWLPRMARRGAGRAPRPPPGWGWPRTPRGRPAPPPCPSACAARATSTADRASWFEWMSERIRYFTSASRLPPRRWRTALTDPLCHRVGAHRRTHRPSRLPRDRPLRARQVGRDIISRFPASGRRPSGGTRRRTVVQIGSAARPLSHCVSALPASRAARRRRPRRPPPGGRAVEQLAGHRVLLARGTPPRRGPRTPRRTGHAQRAPRCARPCRRTPSPGARRPAGPTVVLPAPMKPTSTTRVLAGRSALSHVPCPARGGRRTRGRRPRRTRRPRSRCAPARRERGHRQGHGDAVVVVGAHRGARAGAGRRGPRGRRRSSSTETPMPRRPSARAARRSLSFTRSSAAPVSVKVPSACAAATARIGTSSMSAGTTSGLHRRAAQARGCARSPSRTARARCR